MRVSAGYTTKEVTTLINKRTIEIPCSKDDKVYFWDKGYIVEVTIRWWKATYNGDLEATFFADSIFNHLNFGLSDIGKTVFLSYEEAKAIKM